MLIMLTMANTNNDANINANAITNTNTNSIHLASTVQHDRLTGLLLDGIILCYPGESTGNINAGHFKKSALTREASVKVLHAAASNTVTERHVSLL